MLLQQFLCKISTWREVLHYVWCVKLGAKEIKDLWLLWSVTRDLICVSDTGNVVAIMIPELKGREILALLERHIWITVHITIGTRNLQKYVSRTSVVFVSISFIVLMIISLAWLVFYYIQRFRYANARDRNQVWLRLRR